VNWPHFDCVPEKKRSVIPIMPNNFDWRDKNAVMPVRNQAQCGSCWAFAATASLEGALAIKQDKHEYISPQQMVDCATGEYGKSPYPNNGCNGGLMESAFTYSSRIGYLPESKYPYQGREQNCSLELNSKLNDYVKKTAGCSYISNTGNVEDDIKETQAALYTHGPLAVALDANKLSFRLYKSGIYYEEDCSDEKLSHAVTLVGYGENITNLVIDADENVLDLRQFWSIKNSWSEKWGENGYFKIAKLNNNCGITIAPSFPLL